LPFIASLLILFQKDNLANIPIVRDRDHLHTVLQLHICR